MSWSRRFDEPIMLDDGTKLKTLQQAIAYLRKDEFAFDDDRLLPFEVVLTEVDAESQQHQDLSRSPLRSPIQGHRVTNLSGRNGQLVATVKR